jgi:hypothetical protein
LKTHESINLPFGDDINAQTEGKTILFHNINGIKDEANWHQIMATMKEIKADVFGLAELNRTMNGGEKQRWLNVTKKFFYYSRTACSESDINLDAYKLGGTLTTITGKWQSRITSQGQDSRGLG